MKLTITILTLALILYGCGTGKNTANNSQEHTVTAKDQRMIDKCTKLEVPQSFTPNDDQINDTYSIGTPCELSKFNFKVFNRWGNEVYSTDDQYFSWDGSQNGTATNVSIGTYFYVCEFRYAYENYTLNGNIAVII
ncbi:MAG: gliding motility-associated-like protein [Flavobacteriaceae bacterium]|jgi:gliding motility-associated-like protein